MSRSSLLDRWLSRLGRDSAIDLVERGREIVPELLEVYTPTDFELRLLDGLWLRALDGEVMVELTAELLPLGLAGETGVVERRLDTASRHVHHDKLELPSPAQGVVRGRAMLRQSVDLYVELGIERVSLLAVDTCRYVWAAAGFSFLDDDARTGVVGAIDDAAELLDLGLADLDPESCEPWEIAFLPEVPDISLGEALEVRSPSLAERTGNDADIFNQPLERPGKVLLLADQIDGWQGVLDLRQYDGNQGLEALYDHTE